MTLDQLSLGKTGTVIAISGSVPLQQRLMEFGIFEGEEVTVLTKAPLGDPIEIQIGGTRLSLRKAEAASIQLHLPT